MYLPPDDYFRDDGYSIRPDTFEQHEVYSYIRELSTRPPYEAIEAFYRLLWEGSAYPNTAVNDAWKRVTKSPDFDQNQLKIVNRCYYTLINPWHLDGNRDQALENLILQLDSFSPGKEYSPHLKKLRYALRNYRESDYYSVLKKHLYLLRDRNSSVLISKDRFGDLFADYFFIYEAGTQTRDIEQVGETLNRGILTKRNNRLCQYGNELRQFYVRYGKMPQNKLYNPTHLSNDELH